MSERFTETLRAASEPGWTHAVGHRFVKELLAGAVPAVAVRCAREGEMADDTAETQQPDDTTVRGSARERYAHRVYRVLAA